MIDRLLRMSEDGAARRIEILRPSPAVSASPCNSRASGSSHASPRPLEASCPAGPSLHRRRRPSRNTRELRQGGPVSLPPGMQAFQSQPWGAPPSAVRRSCCGAFATHLLHRSIANPPSPSQDVECGFSFTGWPAPRECGEIQRPGSCQMIRW